MVLKNRKKTLFVATLLFFGSLTLTPLLGQEFAPAEDYGDLSVSAKLDAGLDLNAASVVRKKIESALQNYPGMQEIYTTTKNNDVNLYVQVVDKKHRQKSLKQVAMDLREILSTIPGIEAAVSQTGGPGGVAKDVTFQLLGNNLTDMQVYAEKAKEIMQSIPGAVDVATDYTPGTPEAKLQVQNDRLADLGISTSQVATTINTLFNGQVVSQFQDGNNRYNVRVRLDQVDRKNLSDLNNIFLTSGNDNKSRIALGQVTKTVLSSSPNTISRYDRQEQIQLTCNLNGNTLGQFNKAFLDRVNNELKLPQQYTLLAGGNSQNMTDTFTGMAIALVTAVLFIFFILAAQFESYIDPFSIMLSLPMALIGAIVGLLIFHSSISIMSMIGIIMLMGLVTKNAILLIDFTKQERAKGIVRNEALQKAALTRLRPIVMTSTSMILAMMPLAFGLGNGSESRAPMAHAIIGGLVTSTLLTLVVVPVIYTILDDLKNKFSRST